jgi:hypothetical protein
MGVAETDAIHLRAYGPFLIMWAVSHQIRPNAACINKNLGFLIQRPSLIESDLEN